MYILYCAEDLVLAEERTSKKDRQRIMEGEQSFLVLLCPPIWVLPPPPPIPAS
jgi:hypothetical protein